MAYYNKIIKLPEFRVGGWRGKKGGLSELWIWYIPNDSVMGKWVEWCWESPLMEDGWTQGYMLSWLTAVGEPTLGSVWERGEKKKRENNWKNSCLVVLRQEWCIWPASPQICATAHDTLQSNPLAYRHFLEFLQFTAHHPVLTSLLLTFNKCCCLMLQQRDGLFILNLI